MITLIGADIAHIKSLMTSYLTVKYSSVTKETAIQCDANGMGLGAKLSKGIAGLSHRDGYHPQNKYA